MPTITGTPNRDVLIGTPGDDLIEGLAGDDELDGRAGNDILRGGDGDDQLYDASGGSEQFFGGAGADSLTVRRETGVAPGVSTLIIDGGDGDDRVFLFCNAAGHSLSFTVSGGEGNDSVYVFGVGSGMIDLGSGNDDIEIGLTQSATVTLGAGRDRIRFGLEAEVAVTDFQAGADGDVIRLDTWLSGGFEGWDERNPFAGGFIRAVQSGADTLVQIDRNGGGDAWITGIRLQNVLASSLTAYNFEGWSPAGDPPPGQVIYGTDDWESLYGGYGDDVIYGLGSNDWLYGRGGDDRLEGGAGDDGLLGGAGDDLLYGGEGRDTILVADRDRGYGGAGDDTFTIQPEAGRFLDAWADGGAGDDTFTLSDYRRDGRATVVGGEGADRFKLLFLNEVTIDAGSGADTIEVTDVIAATVTLGAGPDTLHFTTDWVASGPVTVTDFDVGSGGDTIDILDLLKERTTWDQNQNPFDAGVLRFIATANGLRLDILLGSTWEALCILEGVTSTANITQANFVGGFGPSGSQEPDIIYLGEYAQDRFVGGFGDDTLLGELGEDDLSGMAGNDWLDGGRHSDVLSGGTGDDTIIGGWGSDILSGGAGADTFIYRFGDHEDRILDFDAQDRIIISGYSGANRIVQEGLDTVIYFERGNGAHINLSNFQVANLNMAQLIFEGPTTPPRPVVTAPNVSPSPGVESADSLTIHTGQVIYTTAERAVSMLQLDPHNPLSITNRGALTQITGVSDGWGAMGLYYPTVGPTPGQIHNEFGASMRFVATGAGERIFGLYGPSGSPDFRNDGLFEVISYDSYAMGIDTWQGEAFDFVNTGTFRVWGRTSGYGVSLANGGNFINTGLIEVGGLVAGGVGTYRAGNFVNQGVIRAVDGTTSEDSVAFFYGGDSGSFLFTNSGTLEADVAFRASYTGSGAEDLNTARFINSGEARGNVEFLMIGELVNTGLIDGNIIFGSIADYDGRDGRHIGGAVYSSYTADRLWGGADSEWFFSGLGDDDVRGGGGDDVIDAGRGVDMIDGGAGFDTVSFRTETGRAIVDLAGGWSETSERDTLTSIEAVVGSDFNDIITGSADANRLEGGRGADRLAGGAGADTFVFERGDGQDEILDFATSSDRIEIFGYGSASEIRQTGADALVVLAAGDTILVRNVSIATLTPALIFHADVRDRSNEPAAPESLLRIGIRTGDLVEIDAHELLEFRGIPQAILGRSVINAGYVSIENTSDFGSAWGVNTPVAIIGDPAARRFENLAGAELRVVTRGDDASALGVRTETFINHGRVEVVSERYYATGVTAERSPTVFVNSGELLVSAGMSASGLVFTRGAETFENTGTIRVVSGGFAQGVSLGATVEPATYLNAGLIEVEGGQTQPLSGPIIHRAIYFAGSASFTFNNTGTISADVAFQSSSLFGETAAGFRTFVNSGHIAGDWQLGGGVDSIVNTGALIGRIDLGNGDDTYDGRLGDLIGGVFGGAGNDVLLGGAGDDILAGGRDQDSLNGGAGWDVAVFSGQASAYRVFREGDGYRIKGPDGSDFLTGIEVLRFDDKIIELTLIVCDPVTGAISMGDDAPLILPGDTGEATKGGGPLTPPQVDDWQDPLILPSGLDSKVKAEELPVICPPGDLVDAARGTIIRPVIDTSDLGLSTFAGRDPHRFLVENQQVDWIM